MTTTDNKTRLTALPIDELRALEPTKAFYIRHIGKETHVINLSSYLDVLFSAKGYVTSPESEWAGLDIEEAKNIAGKIEITWVLKKENLMGTSVKVMSYEGSESEDKKEGREVAVWKSPVLDLRMGTTKITLLEGHKGEGEGGEEISIAPTGMLRRSEAFVKDGITYIWEVEPSKHEHKHLYKVVGESPDQEKIEIARYSQKSGYATEGLMVLDERELDDLVTILTLCAVLAVVDSFTRNELQTTGKGLFAGMVSCIVM